MENKILKWSLGIDVGAKELRCCLSTIDWLQAVKVKGSHKFSNTLPGYQQLHRWIEKHYKDKTAPLTVSMEATGVYYERCAVFLQKQGYRVSVLLPNKAKAYLKSLGLKSKNDTIDAQGISRMGAEQQLGEWSAMSALLYELRLLTRQHEDLQKSITSFSNQLHAVQKGMYRFEEVENGYIKILDHLEESLQTLTGAMEELIDKDEVLKQKVELLCSIKGVGTLSAATIIAETNGFALFENIKQLTSYAGYDVIENQSGEHIGKTKISKKGNSHIRRILHMPALNMVSYNVKPFKDLYTRVYSRTHIKMKGYVAVQRKLLVVMYTLYKTNQPFTPRHIQTIREEEPKPSFVSASQKL